MRGIVFRLLSKSHKYVLEKKDRPDQLVFQIGISGGTAGVAGNRDSSTAMPAIDQSIKKHQMQKSLSLSTEAFFNTNHTN